MEIRAYQPADEAAVRTLLLAAFKGADEADLVERLRAGDIALELVASKGRQILGYVALSRMPSPKGWLALAPVAVLPKQQGRGMGGALVSIALQYANAPVVVLGAPEYYSRFGFVFGTSAKITSPYSAEFTGFYLPEEAPLPASVSLDYPSAFAGV